MQKNSSKDWDAVIVGGGHNGLVSAFYLASAGLRTLVLEKNAQVGGAAVSEEFHPGYRNSVASYAVSLLRPEIVADMHLAQFGYKTQRIAGAFYPKLDGPGLLLTGSSKDDERELRATDERAAAELAEFHKVVGEIGPVVSDLWLRAPPRLHGGGLPDLISGLRMGQTFRRLSATGRRRMIQFTAGSADALIRRHFTHPQMQAMMGAAALAGNYASLQQPGSALPLLHHTVGELDGKKSAWGIAIGGMGAITQAMSASARAQGAVIRCNAPVARIEKNGGRVCGVQLGDGERVLARIVLANTDPKRTFLELMDIADVPADFAADIRMIRQESASLRMNLALRGLPDFRSRPGVQMSSQHRGFIVFIDSLQSIEDAYLSSRAGAFPSAPIIEALIPSTLDVTLARPGHHVMSLLAKYFPYDLANQACWDEQRESAAENVLGRLRLFISNLDEILVAHQTLTPLDIERRFGMTRGDILHGRLEPDQLLSMRPHADAAQYATPVPGLYLCGSGSHPGGGVTGAPGHNAAKRVLADLGLR